MLRIQRQPGTKSAKCGPNILQNPLQFHGNCAEFSSLMKMCLDGRKLENHCETPVQISYQCHQKRNALYANDHIQHTVKYQLLDITCRNRSSLDAKFRYQTGSRDYLSTQSINVEYSTQKFTKQLFQIFGEQLVSSLQFTTADPHHKYLMVSS